MKKAQDYGHLANVLASSPSVQGKEPKPFLRVHARMDSYGPASDTDYNKTEMLRLQKEIASAESEVANWDHEKVGQRALKSLKSEIAMKKARMMECEALLDENSDSETTEMSDKKGA